MRTWLMLWLMLSLAVSIPAIATEETPDDGHDTYARERKHFYPTANGYLIRLPREDGADPYEEAPPRQPERDPWDFGGATHDSDYHSDSIYEGIPGTDNHRGDPW